MVHSATKYIGGHGDALGGVLVGSDAFISQVRKNVLKELGSVMSPFTAWLLLRGLNTLHVRMERHARSALEIARFLEAHPKIDRVWYPGLESHPQHEVAKAQMRGYSGVLAFELKGGREAGARFIDNLELFSHLANVGDAKSLAIHPATTTHSQLDEAQQLEGGITPELVRLSIGLEHIDDILEDVDQALERSARG